MAPKWWSLLVFCVTICRILDALPIDSQLVETADQETLASQEKSIFGVQPESEDSERYLVREKRTIGFLRQMFPTLSQIIDRKIQAITRFLFRVIGRLILRGGAAGGGGGGGGDSGDGGRRIQITLPTFPPSTDEDEDEDQTESPDDAGSTTPAPFGDESPATSEPDSDADNQLSESKLSPVIVRKVREVEQPQAAEEEEEEEEDDQAAEATGDNELSEAADESEGGGAEEQAAEGTEEQAAEGSEDDPRNKRLVNFNLGGSGGSGGGSGNFLFDIIRLVAGSGTSQAQDEAENAPVDDTNITATAKDDGYGAAVPGPLTRLFVIANRGIANLIQDLILRIAQTSERIVNFKARLITSII